MALIGSINKVSSSIGEGLSLIDSLFQKQITIRSTEDNKDIVLLNVVNNQEIEFVVEITEKPIADLGGAIDYVSRTSTPLVLDAVVSNRNIDLLQDPVEFIAQHAGAFIPELLNVINQTASIGGQFFDLGQDEIDKKITTLIQWQTDVTLVQVFGLRLDARRFTNNTQFTYLIERVTATVNPDTGDNIGVVISLKNLLNVTEPDLDVKKGSRISEIVSGVLQAIRNPFL